jgi:L-ribulokinase
MSKGKLIIGMDFGTDSVRSVVLDGGSGRELASDVAWYKRWAAGDYCDPGRNMFRQHPLDYIEGMVTSVKGALAKLGKRAGKDQGRGKSTLHAVTGPEEARSRAEGLVNRALAGLVDLGPRAEPLRALARFVHSRQK